MTKSKLFLLLFIFALTVLPVRPALADTGPKPSMDFEFNGLPENDLQIVSGILYECDQPDCSDAAPLEHLGPQGLYCDTVSCRALSYGFAPYHILEIEFSDEVTRKSNIFETVGFDSSYIVTVQPNELFVEPRLGLGIFSSIGWLLVICVCCGVGIVLLTALVVYLIRRSRKP